MLETPKSIQPATPGRFTLSAAWPNPFNQSLNLRWNGAERGAELVIVDVVGRPVGRILMNAESGSSVWSASGFPAGTYFIRNVAGLGKPQRVVYLK